MSSAQGIRAGRAFVELFADDSKLVRGLHAAEKKLAAFGTATREIGQKMMLAGADRCCLASAPKGRNTKAQGNALGKLGNNA